MYGLPDSNPLSAVVHELVSSHERTVGDLTGQEPALLLQLQRAIASDTSGAYGGGSTRTGAPIDPSALALWDEIRGCIGEFWPGRGDLRQATTPVPQRLRMWVSAVAGTPNEIHLLEMCEHWIHRIRDLLEPPKRVPLWGVNCPACGHNKVWAPNQYGESALAPAILVHASESPIRAECLACEEHWKGTDLSNLGAADEFAGI